jgi:hypothetical protein
MWRPVERGGVSLYPQNPVQIRRSLQGLCCPVFTERKTGQPSGVVSVAVKAIAVARSYVTNEGSGHQVAFQPFTRQQPAAGAAASAGAAPAGAAAAAAAALAGPAAAGLVPGSGGPTAGMFERHSVGAFPPDCGLGSQAAINRCEDNKGVRGGRERERDFT